MKIGIMSMQRIRNYGSFLQSYGLKTTIENLGHEVEFVDYKIDRPIVEVPKQDLMFRIKRKVKNIFNDSILNKDNINKFYDKEYLPMLGVSNEYKYRTKLDVLIIGSDEVFNCLQWNPRVGYSLELFGKDNNAKKLISYAGSFGHTNMDKIKKYKVYNDISNLLNKFNSISVRDQNSFDIVNDMVENKNKLNINVDPVIIANFDKEIKVKNDLKDYIIVYAYKNRINSKDEIKAIKNFAKLKNKKLISIGTHQDWVDLQIEADPFELLGYIKQADYIITDTFHGTVFSIKYNIPFATIIRDSNKEKLSDLLNRFNLTSREIVDINKIENIFNRNIDFKEVNKIIKFETEKSIKYLKKNLNEL